MQEKPIYIHLEMHKEIVKNAWIISHEGRKMKVNHLETTERLTIRQNRHRRQLLRMVQMDL